MIDPADPGTMPIPMHFNGSPVGYARVSTAEQNPDLQIAALKAAGCAKIFSDAQSGAKSDRPGLAEAMAYLRAGDTLVVWKLDRLGRSLSHLVEVIEDLRKRDIGFRSLTESIDTTTSSGLLIFHIFAALAQFERGLILERTLAGLAAARARGAKPGRKAVVKADHIKRALAMREKGYSVRYIASVLKVSKSSLYRALAEGQGKGEAA